MKRNKDKNEAIKYKWVIDSEEIVISIRISRDQANSKHRFSDENWDYLQDSLLYAWRYGVFPKIKNEFKREIDETVFFMKDLQKD